MSKQIKQSASDAWSDACEAERKAQESVEAAEYRMKLERKRVKQFAERKENATRDWERAHAKVVIAKSKLKEAREAKEACERERILNEG